MQAALKKQVFTIGTIGSHSALQILKGARDEGFRNLVVCERGKTEAYKAFRVADEIIEIDSLKDFAGLEQQLVKENVVLIPHASFFNALSMDQIIAFKPHYFGNKRILLWEESRIKQRAWLQQAGLVLPKIYEKPEDIDGPVIIKFFGAGGGKGYFLARNEAEFKKKIAAHHGRPHIIQEYVVGSPAYIHYFYSPLTDELEIMSMDRRYETNVDSIGRIGARDQMDLNIETSYNIMGNLPLVLRESLLPKLFDMGRKVVEQSKKLEPRGLFGPFCLETVVTPDLEFYVFEISARIVAGTNPYINGSPYADLRYDVPMSTGRRIAREIRMATEQNRLAEVLSNGYPD
ncbi:MAG TPA: formate--phosphoribosylaminoimidazolecarboxamide ligase [Nevskiaceae bacterium]|nr:formate--phosphoribosylaminoimidazolecarboxamide ligase [Nevskiaceae bacterium]